MVGAKNTDKLRLKPHLAAKRSEGILPKPIIEEPIVHTSIYTSRLKELNETVKNKDDTTKLDGSLDVQKVEAQLDDIKTDFKRSLSRMRHFGGKDQEETHSDRVFYSARFRPKATIPRHILKQHRKNTKRSKQKDNLEVRSFSLNNFLAPEFQSNEPSVPIRLEIADPELLEFQLALEQFWFPSVCPYEKFSLIVRTLEYVSSRIQFIPRITDADLELLLLGAIDVANGYDRLLPICMVLIHHVDCTDKRCFDMLSKPPLVSGFNQLLREYAIPVLSDPHSSSQLRYFLYKLHCRYVKTNFMFDVPYEQKLQTLGLLAPWRFLYGSAKNALTLPIAHANTHGVLLDMVVNAPVGMPDGKFSMNIGYNLVPTPKSLYAIVTPHATLFSGACEVIEMRQNTDIYFDMWKERRSLRIIVVRVSNPQTMYSDSVLRAQRLLNRSFIFKMYKEVCDKPIESLLPMNSGFHHERLVLQKFDITLLKPRTKEFVAAINNTLPSLSMPLDMLREMTKYTREKSAPSSPVPSRPQSTLSMRKSPLSRLSEIQISRLSDDEEEAVREVDFTDAGIGVPPDAISEATDSFVDPFSRESGRVESAAHALYDMERFTGVDDLLGKELLDLDPVNDLVHGASESESQYVRPMSQTSSFVPPELTQRVLSSLRASRLSAYSPNELSEEEDDEFIDTLDLEIDPRTGLAILPSRLDDGLETSQRRSSVASSRAATPLERLFGINKIWYLPLISSAHECGAPPYKSIRKIYQPIFGPKGLLHTGMVRQKKELKKDRDELLAADAVYNACFDQALDKLGSFVSVFQGLRTNNQAEKNKLHTNSMHSLHLSSDKMTTRIVDRIWDDAISHNFHPFDSFNAFFEAQKSSQRIPFRLSLLTKTSQIIEEKD
ncbi:hypothetical protein PCE1_000248 [Barthelona sp. PCE]